MILQLHNQPSSMPQNLRGMTLVEVLVAIVILTFGLLGTVGLLATSMRSTNETSNYVLASNLARELAERMRINRQTATGTTSPYIADLTAAPPAPKDCVATSCTVTELAAWDLSEWWNRLSVGGAGGGTAKGLPSPRAVICLDNAPTTSGNLKWDCTAGAGAPMVIKIGWISRNSAGKQDIGTVFDILTAPRVVVLASPGP
jgi:type IV pilus assembly protein PilV